MVVEYKFVLSTLHWLKANIGKFYQIEYSSWEIVL